MKKVLILAVGIWYLLFLIDLEGMLRERSRVSFLQENQIQDAAFREQKLSEEMYQKLHEKAGKNGDWIELLTSSMLDGRFSLKSVTNHGKLYRKYKKEAYESLKKAYRAVWSDIRYFPIASEEMYVEDTWLAPREYGGKRVHEGCDIFGKRCQSGYYPVISMTDGVVEQKGWLPMGGYRIGIRSPSGGYFYYAHLASYEQEFSRGDPVRAGDILGYMGNTGYGEEGTRGKFPVHLHLGIYLSGKDGEEISVNPYWVLQNFRKKIRNYTY